MTLNHRVDSLDSWESSFHVFLFFFFSSVFLCAQSKKQYENQYKWMRQNPQVQKSFSDAYVGSVKTLACLLNNRQTPKPFLPTFCLSKSEYFINKKEWF